MAYESTTHFKCPNCRAFNVVAIEVPELESDGESPPTCEGSVELFCFNCESEFGATVWCSDTECIFTLDQHPRIRFSGDAPTFRENDFWLDFDPPEDPYAIFDQTIRQIEVMVSNKPAHQHDPQLLNRMFFVHAFTALESFLSDTLLIEIADNPQALRALVTRDKYLKDEKFTLSYLANHEDLLGIAARRHIASVTFHNLERVDALYRAALDRPLRLQSTNWEQILRAVALRHDCVHRNGSTLDGQRLQVFNRRFVMETIALIKLIAENARTDPDADLPL